jgi:hypothetical protein
MLRKYEKRILYFRKHSYSIQLSFKPLCTVKFFLLLLFFCLSLHISAQQNSLSFDGVNDYVELNSLADTMAGKTTFTVEFWMLADKNAQTSSIRVDMFAVNDAAFMGDNTFLLTMGGMNSQQGKVIVFDGVTTFDIVSTRVVGDYVCHHIAYVRAGSLGTLYIDGTVEATHTADYAFDTTKRYSLGQEWDNNVTSDFYNGQLDDLRIWGTARTASEISNNMNVQLTGNEPGLIAYYTFDQGVGGGNNTGVTTLLDSGPYGYTGTLNLFTLNGPTSNWVKNCEPKGIENPIGDGTIRVFPVPATDRLEVYGNFGTGMNFTLTDISGREVRTIAATGEYFQIDISDLSAGIYFLRSELVVIRFVKD